MSKYFSTTLLKKKQILLIYTSLKYIEIESTDESYFSFVYLFLLSLKALGNLMESFKTLNYYFSIF